MNFPFTAPGARRVPWLVSATVVMLSLLCVLATLSYANFRRLAQANQWNVHTYQVLDRLSSLRSSLVQEESRLRGFALLRDKTLLLKARGDGESGQVALRQVRGLVRDNPAQERRLARFESGYALWQTRFTIVNPDDLALAAARVTSQTPARRVGLERLRDELTSIQAVERVLLAQRARQQRTSQRLTSQFLLVATICTVIVAALSIFLLDLQTRTVESFNLQLRRSRDQLQGVLDNAPLILYVLGKDEKFDLIAGKGLEKIGLNAENSLGRPLAEVLGADHDMAPVRAALDGLAGISTTQFRGATFEMHRLPLFDENRQITGMMAVGVDITERHLAEEALRASEERYRTVIEGVQEVIFQVDKAGKWRFLNPAWRVLLGYEVAASLGRPCLDFVHPNDVSRLDSVLAALSESETQVFDQELRFLTREGEVRWLHAQAQAQHDATGTYLGAAGTLNDITERKRAGEALGATTRLQRAILDGAPYAIIATSPDGIITSFNRAAQEMLGYGAEEVCDALSIECFHDPLEIAARATQLGEEMGRAFPPSLEVLLFKPRAGMVEEREWTLVRRDGGRVPVRLSVSALHAADSAITGYVAIAYDLSETRRAERVKNEFVSVVSHELRTPLTSIRGALGLLAGGAAGPMPPSAKQMLDIAQKNSERLVLLINDILDIEKIESEQMRFDLRPLALRELLETACEQNSAYGEALGVRLRVEDPDSLNEMQVLGDENRLQQVLSNLLSNACKFTPSGGAVHLGAHLQGAMVRVEVRDEGPGVSSEFVPRLFEKFAQADSSSTRKQGGTGLGLPIARAIVERHGGVLDYLPPFEGAAGATFFFDLPLAVATEAAIAPETETFRPRVLICEEDGEVAQQLRLSVGQNGFQADIAPTLGEARQLLKRGDYAGLLLDLKLPDGNGLELLSELRADQTRRELPVVVISAYCEAGQLRGEAFGLLDWICKPIDTQRVQAVLTKLRREGAARVLHVEDDADVRRITAMILGDSAHIVAATSLREASDLLQDDHFDLAILDIGLPDGNGLDLLPLLRACDPTVPVILFSASEPSSEDARTVTATLVKSRTDNQTLRETIRRCLIDRD